MKLRRFWLFTSVTALAIIGLFCVFELTGWSEMMTLPDPGGASQTTVAVLGVLLLVADVLLPVPSSLVMLAHGAIFDVPLGTVLSTLGATGATFVGHRLGRAGSAVVARWVTGEEMVSARALFERWGMAAIVLSRPVPVLAETLAIVAGAMGYAAGRTVLAGALGSLPAAALYAWAGARGLSGANSAWVLGAVLAISAVLWALGRRNQAS
jgi:uncharacterized membrane protein YdjX (TVP38/TMEM64 family)